MNLLTAIKSIFKPPTQDPKRFAVAAAPHNWNGDAVAKQTTKGGPILVDQHRQVFEFGLYSNIDIPEHLTELDKQELRRHKLAPEKPYYAKAKAYFSKNPNCTKEDLAANSGSTPDDPEYFEQISINTADKVRQAFRAFLVDKPTF
jgi:hypothetical protein